MHYLGDDKLALKNTANTLKPLKIRSPMRKEVQLLSRLPKPKLVRFLIRTSYCDISVQLSSAFHYMRFSNIQHSSLGAKIQLFSLVISLHFF